LLRTGNNFSKKESAQSADSFFVHAISLMYEYLAM